MISFHINAKLTFEKQYYIHSYIFSNSTPHGKILCLNQICFRNIHWSHLEQKQKKDKIMIMVIIIIFVFLDEKAWEIEYIQFITALAHVQHFYRFLCCVMFNSFYDPHIYRISITSNFIKPILIGLYAFYIIIVMVWSTYFFI